MTRGSARAAAEAGAAAAANAGNNEGPNGGAQVAFSLRPGHHQGEVISMNTKQGYNHWKLATEKLDEELYDCDPEGFYQFMKTLGSRADKCGWTEPDGILSIPTGENEIKSLITDYGSIEYDQVKSYELSFVNQDSRKAQDTAMLHDCIMNSVSKEGKAKLNVNEELYKFGRRQGGACLLKVLIRESYLDSNATSSMIRIKLANLDEYIVQVKHDIGKFNNYVKVLVETLRARGETTSDLITNLFQAYAACSDQQFVKHIADVQSQWEDNEKPLTEVQLMEKALKKYRLLKDRGVWEAPTAQDAKIIALEAKIHKLTNGGRSKRKGDKDSKDGKKKKQKKEKPKWMFQRPKDEDLKKPREWNGIKWWYCSPDTGGKCQGVYRVHKPSECKSLKPKGESGPKKGTGGGDDKVAVTVSQATIDPALSDIYMEDEDEIMGGYETG